MATSDGCYLPNQKWQAFAGVNRGALEVLDGLPKPPGDLSQSAERVFVLERTSLRSVFCYACERAGIENFTWHDLRHEALSRLSEKTDFSMLELVSISGHKTLQMLVKYSHLRAGRLAEKMG